MKQLVIDTEHPNGIMIDVENTFDPIPYKERVVNRIRAVYSIDDELALLRQRDKKPSEFAEYDAFVENIKAEEREG